jgi:hypothetical protein
MTNREFNEKYKDYLEDRYSGCCLIQEKQLEYLDNSFKQFILIPNFKYKQIKAKFDFYCFYCSGLSDEIVTKVVRDLKSLESSTI